MSARFAVLVAAVGLVVSSTPHVHVVAAQEPVFQGGVDLVNLGVTVTDRKGRLVDHLTAGTFSVMEDGRPQTVRVFAAGGASGPALHVGILIDVSESMGQEIDFTRTAAIKFLRALPEAVDMTLVDFDTEVRGARYTSRDFPRLVERIRQQKPKGFTALYDAIGVYLDGASSQDGRKIMVVYTDGSDTRSALAFGELLDLLKASDVTVYVIDSAERSPSGFQGESHLVLRQIADTTGGVAFFPNSTAELDRMYEQVVAEIHAQYTLGYLSTNEKADGTWRKVDVKVIGPEGEGVRVRARRGYFARRSIP